jgi:tellurite resistance protein
MSGDRSRLEQGIIERIKSALVNAAGMSAISEQIVNDKSKQNKQKTTRNDEQFKKSDDNENVRLPLTISMKHFEEALKKTRRYVTTHRTNTNLAHLE